MAGLGVAEAAEGGLLVVVGFGVGALGAVAGRFWDLVNAPAIEHKARPPACGDESPRSVDFLFRNVLFLLKYQHGPEIS